MQPGDTRACLPYTEPPSDDYDHCPQSMYSAQVAEFVDAITEGRQPLPSGEDGRVVMQVVDAAYRRRGWPRMSIVLGVDGGGSKTHAAVVDDDGALLGFATGGPSNWETVGLRGAADSLRDAAEKAPGAGQEDAARPEIGRIRAGGRRLAVG